MKFLVDENLSERVAEVLVENGHDAIHVRDIGLERADDPVVMARAEARAVSSCRRTLTSGPSWPGPGTARRA